MRKKTNKTESEERKKIFFTCININYIDGWF